MFVEDLTEIDYRILRFFRDNSPASIEDAKKTLPDVESIEYRIEHLSTYETRNNGFVTIPVDNSACLRKNYQKNIETKPRFDPKPPDTFSITTLGKKALQDYEVAEKQHRKEIWLVNAKIPIVVSIATNLLIYGIQWLLLPMLQ